MEDYRNKVVNCMQSNPRIPANLLAKPNQNPLIGVYIGGGHGGAEPPSRASPKACESHETQRANPFGAMAPGGVSGAFPSRGAFPEQSSPDGPPNLGVARICWGVLLVAIVTDSLPICMDFLGRFILSQ